MPAESLDPGNTKTTVLSEADFHLLLVLACPWHLQKGDVFKIINPNKTVLGYKQILC